MSCLPSFTIIPSLWCSSAFTASLPNRTHSAATSEATNSTHQTATSFSATYPRHSEHSAYLRIIKTGNPRSSRFGIFVVLEDEFLGLKGNAAEKYPREVRIKFKITFGDIEPWHVACHLVPEHPSDHPPLDFLIYLTVTSPTLSGLSVSSIRTYFDPWRSKESFRAPVTTYSPSDGSGAVRIGRFFLFQPSPVEIRLHDLREGETILEQQQSGTGKYGIVKHVKLLSGSRGGQSIELYFFPYLPATAGKIAKCLYDKSTRKARKILGFGNRWEEGRELIIERDDEESEFEEDFGEDGRVEIRIGKRGG
ncbi:hypothetical protein BT69DRAFT_1347379 [Atractiella rhizophila]|nr:hypothetical protein BT69DRAFT_1347379 [Atractiella rhizophila]